MIAEAAPPGQTCPRVKTGDIATIRGARRAPMFRAIEPQLASVATVVPAGDDWLHEIKLDGYRLLAHFDSGHIKLVTRHGLDWTPRFHALARALERASIKQAILDGEVVVLDKQGISSFQALQNALQALPSKRAEMVYYSFDLPYLDGWDLRDVPLEQRKALLRRLIPTDGPSIAALRFSDHMIGQGPASREQACRMGLEGIVCKRRDAVYRSGRTTTWLKAKCAARQEFVLGGFTDPAGSREHFGALLLGLFDPVDHGELLYAGKCGSGFSEASLRELYRKLRPLEQPQTAFRDPPRGADARGVHWLRPTLVAEISFTGFTDNGRARHAIFQGLREDKPASEVERESPAKIR
jgi:bifunctional non-homologous end joining protein LigD